MAEIRVVLPERSADVVSDALRRLTARLRELGHETSGGLLGGEDGYGAYYEDDLFLMHPFCWCGRDECPWCGGCQGEHGEPQHNPDCYRWLVHRDLIAAGFRQTTWTTGPYVQAPRGMSWDEQREVRRAVWQKWCEHFGLPYPDGCAVHCTCGAEEDRRRRVDACECDWHLGCGVFRFGPQADAPNFWHKPTGFRVTWYKYIGRSMEIEPGTATHLVACIEECVARVTEELARAQEKRDGGLRR